MAISFVESTGNATINGGNVTITLPGSYTAGDVAYVAVTLGTSKATTLACRSSSGGPYSQIISTINSSFARFGVFRQVIPSSSGLTQAVVTGSGGSTDATAAVCHIFRGVDQSTPEDATPTSTTGNSSLPDSPSITVVSCSCVIISAQGSQSVISFTAPSSFNNSQNAIGNDTRDASVSAAWILNASTAAFNPAAWTNTTGTAAWCSATIALRPAAGTTIDWAALFAGPDISSQIDEMRRVTVTSY